MAADPTGSPSEADDLEQFRAYRRSGRRQLRNQIVERHLGLAAHIARRYARDQTDDDLRQVAMLALVRAVDRFDPDRGVAFASFAGRTIEGELKRHFRDHAWAVRVPRRVKEQHLAVRDATELLGQRLGRAPQVTELARHLDLDTDEVIEALAAGAAQHSTALGSATGSESPEQHTDRTAILATEDPGFERSENRAIVQDLLAGLEERERRILELRFFEERSQSEIATELGISQMHVSRLLRRTVGELREQTG